MLSNSVHAFDHYLLFKSASICTTSWSLCLHAKAKITDIISVAVATFFFDPNNILTERIQSLDIEVFFFPHADTSSDLFYLH